MHVLIYCNYTFFGCPSHLSSGVQKTVTVASGTGDSNGATTFPQRGLISKKKKKLRGLSPRANYTDRAAAAGRRS